MSSMTSKLKAVRGCSSHYLQGAGAYYVNYDTGLTACLVLMIILLTYCLAIGLHLSNLPLCTLTSYWSFFLGREKADRWQCTRVDITCQRSRLFSFQLFKDTGCLTFTVIQVRY